MRILTIRPYSQDGCHPYHSKIEVGWAIFTKMILFTLLLSSTLSALCETNINCADSENAWCDTVTGNCVMCMEHGQCDRYSYCDIPNQVCREFYEDLRDEDTILGGFCNLPTVDASCVADGFLCGKCNEANDALIWKGICIQNECHECSIALEDPEQDNGILWPMHVNQGICRPLSPMGPAGAVASFQTAMQVPFGGAQSAYTISFIVIGIFFMLSLLAQIVIMFKTK